MIFVVLAMGRGEASLFPYKIRPESASMTQAAEAYSRGAGEEEAAGGIWSGGISVTVCMSELGSAGRFAM